LLGSSMAWALKSRGLCPQILAWSRSEPTRKKCAQSEWCGAVFDNIKDAVLDADLIVLSSTPSSIPLVAQEAAKFAKPGAIATDLGSVKTEIAKKCAEIFKGSGADFVPSHPMAGSDKSGPENADKNLFENACVFVCAPESSQPAQKIADMWRALGAHAHFLTPERHDEIAACISHIPQAAATSLALFAASKGADIFKNFAGNGFKDTTRIAKSSPEMWVDIFAQNSENVANGLREFIKIADEFARAVENKDSEKIRELMSKAKAARLDMEKQYE
ncbi:MAG: prephenate dehydrogenase/arogenate dehydrogenase family protein, partial [Opitutales bacterium]|nr:prephenate dehydrogenase/arogenate dehydrogenase family protein [Opitutales bacterium]